MWRRIIMQLLCLASFLAHVPSSAEYDAAMRYNPRRMQEVQTRQYAGGSRQQPPYQQPGGGNNAIIEVAAYQPPSREYLQRTHESPTTNGQHKCLIWVPDESVSKYPLAEVVQKDVTNKLTYITVCCTGYWPTRHLATTVCRPVCGCQNGGCRVPGDCECYEGFVKNDNGDCVFACPLGCQNGRCYLDGSCQCDPGYTLDETRRFCRPICSSGCDNNPRHNCSEPETCSCAKGYQLTNRGCEPVCEPDCGIGGICRDNNQCDCGPGYALKDGVCQSDCYQKCNNGICVSRNRCICDPGFTYHQHSTMCVPV